MILKLFNTATLNSSRAAADFLFFIASVDQPPRYLVKLAFQSIDINISADASQRPATMNAPDISDRVLKFIANRIHTVPELEALLLLWQEPSKLWRVEEVAQRLYVSVDAAAAILRALQTRQLASGEGQPTLYRYSSAWDESGTLMAEVAETYRRNLVRVATLIHSGASSAVREFARAFTLKKDR